MSSRWRLDGYNAIVTGGSKGLGRACVEELLELGANVLITARGEAELQAVSDELIIKHPGRLSFIAADVSTEDGRAKLIERATELFDAGVVDILVNNVGTNDRKPASDVTAADYEKLVSTNQTSAFFLSTALLPMLRKSTNGASVVNVTSLAGIRSSGTGVSSHAGLMGLTRQARSEAPQSQLPIIDLDVLRPGMSELAAVSKLAGKLGLGYNGTPEPEMAFDGSSQRVPRLTEAAGSLGGPIKLYFDARGAVSNLRVVSQEEDDSEPVSYTHLTLPTICSV